MNLSSKQQNWFAKYWPVLLIGAAWLWLFWPMMTGQTVCGFRDSAYLYYPLFKWIDAQWAAGDIPLWNHYDQFGVPVVADGSSSVFYPGKLIFFLRFLSYESRYGIYLASHVLIAAASCYWFARRLGCKQGGATFAAISYSFGGSVLFQVCNVIYLVGAAWLPAALGCLWLMFRKRSIGWAVAGGFCCALIVLGGDPQLVYNIGLIGLGTIASKTWRARQTGHRSGDFRFLSPWGAVIGHTFRLTILVIVTAMLAAIQIIPLSEWSSDSVRSEFQSPRNVYELYGVFNHRYPAGVFDNSIEGLVSTPQVGSHLDHVYQFSQPPWSILELLSPNVSGKPFPHNGRWVNALPGADRMWVPSLYCGCLAAFLSVLSLRLWGKRRRQVWLTRVGLFFAIGSFGWYGPAWLIGEFADLSKLPFDLGPQVGGIYWLIVVGLPKYVMFRYPAKLFVIASLMMCLLGGLAISRIRRLSPKRIKIFWLTPLIGYSVAIITSLVLPTLTIAWPQVPSDPLFGPFMFDETMTSFQYSLVVAFITWVLAWVTFRSFYHLKLNPRGKNCWFGLVICIIAITDLILANSWMLAEVPSKTFLNPVKRSLDATSPLMVLPSPAKWQEESSEHRLAEIITWQRENLIPKHHLEIPTRHEESFTSVVRRLPMHAREGPTFFAFVRNRDGEREAKVVAARNGYYRIETDNQNEGRFLRVESYNMPDWQVVVKDRRGQDFLGEIRKWRNYLFYIEIPAGKCTVELTYRPKAFYRGAWISGPSWSMLGLFAVFHWIRRKQKRNRNGKS